MGLIHVSRGERKFVLEPEWHGSRKIEMPVERLEAIFLEYPNLKGHGPELIAAYLNGKADEVQKEAAMQRRAQTHREIINRARRNGTEIWLGDYTAQHKSSHITGSKIKTALAAVKFWGAHFWLNRKGDASKRKRSVRAIKKFNKIYPNPEERDSLFASKINHLANVTGFKRIGIRTGSMHVGLTDMLEGERKEQKTKRMFGPPPKGQHLQMHI